MPGVETFRIPYGRREVDIEMKHVSPITKLLWALAAFTAALAELVRVLKS